MPPEPYATQPPRVVQLSPPQKVWTLGLFSVDGQQEGVHVVGPFLAVALVEEWCRGTSEVPEERNWYHWVILTLGAPADYETILQSEAFLSPDDAFAGAGEYAVNWQRRRARHGQPDIPIPVLPYEPAPRDVQLESITAGSVPHSLNPGHW